MQERCILADCAWGWRKKRGWRRKFEFGLELGQLRGAAAIEAAIKSSKTEDDSENTNGENDSGAAQVNTLPNPPTSAASTASNSGGALGANFSFDYDKATAGETLNIPAVLWDRPAGSSKRVPPPVPPRSPRRPYDHVTSFANASEQAFRGDFGLLLIWALYLK